MLPTDDEIFAGDSSSSPDLPYELRSNPSDEALIAAIRSVKAEIDPVVDHFRRRRPSRNAAERLEEQMDELFKLIDQTYLPQAEQGRRVNLERIRRSLLRGVIATSLINDAERSVPELEEIYEHLSSLRGALRDFVAAYDAEGG